MDDRRAPQGSEAYKLLNCRVLLGKGDCLRCRNYRLELRLADLEAFILGPREEEWAQLLDAAAHRDPEA